MSEVVDGSFNDADGRKKSFVRRREGETDEQFALRAMALLIESGQIDPEHG